MTVRIRGIYATALTALLDDVVQASSPIQARFDSPFPVAHADASVETTGDRQGVGVHGDPERVREITGKLTGVGRDTFVWEGSLQRGGVYAGTVTETLGSGALVDCGPGTGFLPYSKTARHVEEGDHLRVQAAEPRPPWRDGRPVLDTTVRVHGDIGSLVRGGTTGGGNGPVLADVLPADPPEGWGVEWWELAEDADLNALAEALDALGDRARSIDAGFADAPAPGGQPGHTYWAGEASRWVWFGRESRFALDEHRRSVVPTMAGHHRIKAGGNGASTAVDFFERVCASADGDPPLPVDDPPLEGDDAEDAVPFAAVTEQFGPATGDSVHIGHGKPDGRRYDLGPGTVTARDEDSVTVERTLSGGGTYDGLGVPKESGDVATTTFTEGRWWYPTVYRGEDGTRRGTYVNVCTPLEVFPDAVRYVDLHVDVVKRPDGTVERVDDDELDDAVAEGHVSEALARRAREVAGSVENAL